MNNDESLLGVDSLAALYKNVPLSEKLSFLHQMLRGRCPFVDRVAVALHDPQTDLLKTFVHSTGGGSPLVHYQARLSDVPSLKQLAETARPRIINNLSIYPTSDRTHAQRLKDYGASYTLPLFAKGRLLGFVFFNSRQSDVFVPERLHDMDVFGHLIGLIVINELTTAQTLVAAIKTTTDIAHHRDPETGNHLERMARYTRLIALEVADRYNLNDEFIEHLFLFAPLHDVGKVGIPDAILLKKGRLTAEEYEVMKTHAQKGREIIDLLIDNFRLGAAGYNAMLRHIAEYHHEAMNGTGYPRGLRGDEIPIEARIVAVADVFDALTSRRPYKEAWDNDRAFATLQQAAGTQLDQECVKALLRRRDEVEQIQQLFQEDYFG